MEVLANTWVLWLTLAALLVGGMVVYRQNRKAAGSLYTSSEDFSIHTILLNTRKGEGDIFVGFLLAMISFSLFVAGFVHWIRTLFVF
jgi:hypothetical protein